MEEWREIKGFEKYLVSNKGRVYSKKSHKIMKLQKNKKGYLGVTLYENGKNNHMVVHRIVAQQFIENQDNLPQINHKNENKTDNCVENLEWCTNKYNKNYGTGTERMRAKVKNCKSTSVPVKCLETGEVYPSIREATRTTGANNIARCCIGKSHTAGGFHWEYATALRRPDNGKVSVRCAG